MFIDTHTHMISRVTDDYEKMTAAGVVACIEPAFWLGQPRTNVGSYIDYLSTIVGWERFRAGQFGMRHYCTIGLNSKEANNEELAEAVMEILPRFALKEGVVAIGEIGYDEQTELEDRYFRQQLDLARELDMPVMVHTPHRDKKRGTTRSMDVVLEQGVDPSFVIIDHNNEETAQEVLDRGFWAGFSIYPWHQDGQRAHGRDRPPLRAGAHPGGLRLRLGRVRPPGRAAHRRAAAPWRDQRGGDPPSDLRQRACRLWPQRADARSRLARPGAYRPAHAIHGQLGAARRADAQSRN